MSFCPFNCELLEYAFVPNSNMGGGERAAASSGLECSLLEFLDLAEQTQKVVADLHELA